MLHFVLGGARSGKSRYAENLAKQHEAQGKTVIYIATAKTQFIDEAGWPSVNQEMLQRIETHQADRPSHWRTIETPIELTETLQRLDASNYCILIDCLTLWTLNLLEETCLQKQKQALLKALPELNAEVIIVSNEVGMGVVPLGEFTREYVDELGRLHQAIGELANSMVFMVAGQAIQVK